MVMFNCRSKNNVLYIHGYDIMSEMLAARCAGLILTDAELA